MFEVIIGKNVEFTVRASEKIVLIARLVGECSEGLHFKDEVQNETFSIRKSDITSVRSI